MVSRAIGPSAEGHSSAACAHYGAWNRRGDPYGGAIRFGSAYLRLRPEVTARSTFCFPDSVLEPVDVDGPTF